jgi:hypothetical protein
LLKDYLSRPLDDYQRIVGQVNLASALVHERHYHDAETTLGELEASTRRQNLSALYGNTLERRAELSIYQHNWLAAENCLKKAEDAVRQAEGFDAFFVRKWRIILHPFQHPKSGLRQLEQFREVARGNEHWETVRECDAHRAIVCKERKTLLHVYFGTPYRSYQERLLKDFEESVDLPEVYVWAFGKRKGENQKYDLFRDSTALKFGQLKHRFMKTLTSDFYRPFRVGHLFSEVYSGELFQVNGSRARIHEGIKDLRRWLKRNHIPLRILEHRGEYHLSSEAQLGLVVHSNKWWHRNSLKGLDRIREKANSEPFSAVQVASWLDVPRRTAFELLKEGLEKKLFLKSGAGPSTRYRVNSQTE